MYAIVKTGGKQIKVAKGDTINVEKLPVAVGESVTLEHVLLVSDGTKTTVGAPLVAGAKVVAKVLEQYKGEKVIIFKKRRRQNSRRKNGHRQLISTIQIESISVK
jgi:large subunit ribosomal protein L21